MKAYYEFTQHIEQDICKTYSFHRYLAIVLTHFTFGLGHLVSPYARKIWFYVAKKYYYYILSVFGVWNNAIYKSFRFSKPLVLIHGLKDNIVKEDVPKKILKKVTGKNVNIIYLKESDHRLSTETDLKMITQSIEYIRKNL